jgi:hypothetical protein
MNGKYNRKTIFIGEATWLAGTEVKRKKEKLRTAAAILANWHKRFQRESHAYRMGGKMSEFLSRPEVVKPAKVCIQNNLALGLDRIVDG